MKVGFLLVSFFVLLQSVSAQKLKAYKTYSKDSVYVQYINLFNIPIEINQSPNDTIKGKVHIEPYALLNYKDTLKRAIVIPLQIVKDTTQLDLKRFINFDASFGNPNMKPDRSKYILPFLKGRSYEIMQSFGGSFSHNLKSSYYAIDFNLQVGDTIVAARDGFVFFVKEDSKEHCPTRKCMYKANKILILHNDGTYANYVHLDFKGALVNVGDFVKAGDIIGISGMTGFTTKPHLHFVVHKARKASVPIRFKGVLRKKLKRGKVYKRKR